MKLGDKIFVISTGKVETKIIQSVISYRGCVTGYFLRTHSDQVTVKVNRKDIFADEKGATKELFIRNLKKQEESKRPAEDVKGDRHWISGHKERKWE